MKNYKYAFTGLLFLLVGSFLSAQTYNMNTGPQACPGNTGIDATYDCAFDGGGPLVLGTFTDTNSPGSVLSTMSIVAYVACSGTATYFLNGVPITPGSGTGLSCSCESIISNSNITQPYTITVTPAIQSAFIAGGVNTLSVETNSSLLGAQCFYGADVTLTAGPVSVPTLGTWGLILFALLLVCIGAVAVWRRQKAMTTAA